MRSPETQWGDPKETRTVGALASLTRSLMIATAIFMGIVSAGMTCTLVAVRVASCGGER